MNRYRYVGLDRRLKGCTAIGKWIGGCFAVQVDQFDHRWSHKWHVTNRFHWKLRTE